MKEIVIEIRDEVYERLLKPDESMDYTTAMNVRYAIKNGKVLPNGHGRLIDIDKAIETEEVFHKYFHIAINPLYGRTIGCTAPTVIDEDKEDKE